MRTGKVFYKNRYAGLLVQEGEEYRFTYDLDYIKDGVPISISLPLQPSAIVDSELHPFFENLVSEGGMKKLNRTHTVRSPKGSLMPIKTEFPAISLVY